MPKGEGPLSLGLSSCSCFTKGKTLIHWNPHCFFFNKRNKSQLPSLSLNSINHVFIKLLYIKQSGSFESGYIVHPLNQTLPTSQGSGQNPSFKFNKNPTLFNTFLFLIPPSHPLTFLLAYIKQQEQKLYHSGKNSEMVLAGFHNDPEFANVDSSENESVPFKGTILRTKSGHISSTIGEPCVSCTTFNILAPIYKRLDKQNQSVRESDFRAFWFARNERIVDWLLYESSSIICLQEVWVGNEELVHMFEERLGAAGYDTFKLARTNNRGDGLLTAIHKEYFRVLNHRELFFNDFGDRVAQLLHVQSVVPFSINQNDSVEQEILIVNTHLLFPHDSSLSIVRLHQVYQILQYLEKYQRENKLSQMPVILCGDWNGSKRGHVYKFLRSQGFVSSYDIAHEYTDSDADSHKWVSHRNHRGNICGVDFIWLRNPNKSRKSLKISWAEAAFGIIKYELQKASLAENDAFAFLRADNNGNYITYSAFCDAFKQVNLTGLPHGLSFQETKDLWAQADFDGNGVVDYEEFKRIWDSAWSEHMEEDCSLEEDSNEGIEEEAIGFAVKNAVLFPREVEKGIWPENYSLSDHARLTAVFSPVRLRCSQQSL